MSDATPVERAGDSLPVQPVPEAPQELARRAVGAGIWTLLGRVSVGLAALGGSSLIARMLTPPDVAAYALSSSAATVGGLIGGLGLSQVVVRFTAAARAGGDDLAASRAVRRCLQLGLGGTITVAAGYAVLAQQGFGSGLGPAAIPAVLVAALMVAFGVQVLVAECHRGLGDVRAASLFGGPVASGLLFVSLAVFWIAGLQPGVVELVALAGATAGVAVLASLAALGRRLHGLAGGGERPQVTPQTPESVTVPAFVPSAGRLLATSVPLLLSVLLYAAFTQVDLWVLGATHHGTDVAVYSVASGVASFVGMPMVVVNGALLPMIAELFTKGRTQELGRILRLGSAAAAVPAAAATLLFALCGGLLLGFVYGPVYQDGAAALAILAAGHAVAAWTGPSAATMAMCGHERLILLLSALTAGATVVGILLLVPAAGLVVAAAVTAGGLVVQNIALLLATRATTGLWVCAIPPGRRRARGRHVREVTDSVPAQSAPTPDIAVAWPVRETP